jgi:hypothetical protein
MINRYREEKNCAGMTNSAAYEHFTGKECLDAHLLKPPRLEVHPGPPDVVCADDGQPAGPAWLEYPYRKSHPIIRWLPWKLAAWIGENYGQKLQIPRVLLPPKRYLELTISDPACAYLPKIHADKTRIWTDISYMYLKMIHTDMHSHMHTIQSSAYPI